MKETPFCQFLELLTRYIYIYSRWNCALNSFRKRLLGPPTLKDMISWFNLFDMFVHVVHVCLLQSIVFITVLTRLLTVSENPLNPTPIMCPKESSYPKPSKVQLILREALRWTVFRCDDHENHHLWSWIITLSSFIICIVIIISWHDKGVKSRLSFILPLSMINPHHHHVLLMLSSAFCVDTCQYPNDTRTHVYQPTARRLSNFSLDEIRRCVQLEDGFIRSSTPTWGDLYDIVADVVQRSLYIMSCRTGAQGLI